MTKLPEYHPVCGHRVGEGYTGTLDITTNQTVQNDTEIQAINETVEKDMVEGGVMGSVKASLVGGEFLSHRLSERTDNNSRQGGSHRYRASLRNSQY